MKVLQIGKYYPPVEGGMETCTYNLAEGLNRRRGLHCDVLCANDKPLSEISNARGYSVYRLKSFGKYFSTALTPGMVPALREAARNYDILHVHLPNPMANLALFLARPRCIVIVHWHSDIIRQKRLLRLYEPLQEWLLRRADAIIAATPAYMADSPYLLRYRDKVSVIPYGIDERVLTATESSVSAIKAKHRGKRIVFGLGRLIYYKGFHHLAESAKYLPDDYVIVIGGDGPLRDDLQRQIVRDDLKDKVFLVGKIDNMDLGSYFAACDVFCLSSIAKSEAFGIVQIEAMSFGKPVVATKIAGSGVDWVNADGVTGINVPVGQPKAIAEAVLKICSSERLYDEFAENCRQRFNALFTVERMIDLTVDLFERKLGK